MFFIGIDVGKGNNEVALEVTLINEKRIPVGKTIRITNTKSFPSRVEHVFIQ